MISREKIAAELDARRVHLMDRAEIGREELARRAEEIREQFAENMTTDVVTNFAGWTLVSTGIAWGVTDWMKGRRMMRSLVLPISLIVMGTALLSGGRAWQRRSVHIGETESRVRDELRELDPFARLRVLREVAEETVPFIHRISHRN